MRNFFYVDDEEAFDWSSRKLTFRYMNRKNRMSKQGMLDPYNDGGVYILGAEEIVISQIRRDRFSSNIFKFFQ